MKKRFVICSHTGYFRGGAENSLLIFLKGTQIPKKDIIVTIPQNAEYKDKLDEIGIDNIYISKGNDKTSFNSYIRNPIKLFKRLIWRGIFAVRFFLLLLRCNPEIVYLNTIYCGTEAIIAKLLGKKVIWHIRGLPGKYKLRIPMFKYCPSIILTCATSEKRLLQDLGIKKDIRVVYNGIDIDEFLYNNDSEYSTNDKIIVGNISRISYEKGIDIFCEIAEILSDKYDNIRFEYTGKIAMGEEKYLQELLQRYKSIIDNGKLVIREHTKEVLHLLNNTDIVLFTSRKEGFSRSILEAMCTKRPIICFDTDGANDQIDNNISGVLIESYNISVMIEHLERMINDYELRKFLGNNARNKVEEFTVERYILNIDNTFDTLLHKQ